MIKYKLSNSLILLLPLTVFATQEYNSGTRATEQNDEITTQAVVQHNNKVCADERYMGANTQVKLSIDTNNYTYSITNGQPWSGISNTMNPGCLTFKAGRSKSTKVVNWVKNELAANGVDWAQRNMGTTIETNSDTKPEQLNFAAKVDLSLKFGQRTYLCKNVIIGQGSTYNWVPYNNWWFFSNVNNVKNNNEVGIKCTTSSGSEKTIYFLKYGKSHMDLGSFDWILRFEE